MKEHSANTSEATPSKPYEFQSQPVQSETLAPGSQPVTFVLDTQVMQKAIGFCEEHSIDAGLFYLTAFRGLLYRFNIYNQVSFLNVSDGSSYELPACSEDTGALSFLSLLDNVKPSITADAPTGSPSGSVVFVFRDQGSEDQRMVGLEDRRASFTFCLSTGQLFIVSKFDEFDTEKMAAHFQALISSVLAKPSEKIGALSIVTPGQQQVLEEFNGTLSPFPDTETLVSLFERQAACTPSNIAIYADGSIMTYGELNKKANQLARHLQALGIRSGDNVGILTDRSFDMVIAMFAILKCGGAYVPVPPEYPADRQMHIVRQSNVRCLLFNTAHTIDAKPELGMIDIRVADHYDHSSEDLGVSIDPAQLAYTIYTSGSTGLPKGVMIEHRSAVNLVHWVNTEFNVTEEDRLLFITSMGFDLSVYDIFGMLSAGGSIVMVKREDIANASKLAKLMQDHKVTIWDSVPSTMDHLVNQLVNTNSGYSQNSLRVVLLSGDWIPVSLPEKISKFFTNAKTISLGGATEGTVWSNYYPVEGSTTGWRSVPYGKPIANNTFYILNNYLQPVPCGVTGELFIGGIGVARGYANDAEKTERSFLPDPFYAKWGGRMYRTGDLGRMMPDGNMEFIGRKDSQVKIRGHRVELGEIENVIRQGQTVSTAVVLFLKERQQLAAYVVPAQYYDRDTLVARLKKKLPDYMIPSKWVELEAMPLTGNGKIDTKALLSVAPDDGIKDTYVAPSTDTETALAEVWQQVLGLEKVGTRDNFFELGGQSLMAVELITEMEKKLNKTLPVNILYKHPTIAELAVFVEHEVVEKKWRSLTTIKQSGNKTPLYLVHGDGLSLSAFHNLAQHIDPDQPVFSLQPIGLNGDDEDYDSITDIARYYVSEILEHNPSGVYALGGYSFGGYVAIEMKKQLEAMGKQVKLLALFDTNAQNVLYNKSWVMTLPLRLKRQIPKFMFIIKRLVTKPDAMLQYQYNVLAKKVSEVCYALGVKKKPELKGINGQISKIDQKHLKALRNYQLVPFDKVHLFKAKTRMYFVDDPTYLGWSKYARHGVQVYDVPGDHKTIFEPPNVCTLARSLQQALDNC